jgi:hypothetical protein
VKYGLAVAIIGLAFLCGLTDFGRSIHFGYDVLVVLVLCAFIGAIILHARRTTDGS